MAIFKGSRYENSLFTEVRKQGGKAKKYVHPRAPERILNKDFLPKTNLKDGDMLDLLAFRLFGDEEGWHVLAEANDILFPLGLEDLNELVIPG